MINGVHYNNYKIINREYFPPIMKKEIVSRQKLTDELKSKLEYIADIYQAHGLFDYFKTHLEAENPKARELERLIETEPESYIKTLNTIYLRGTLKGKCPACPK